MTVNGEWPNDEGVRGSDPNQKQESFSPAFLFYAAFVIRHSPFVIDQASEETGPTRTRTWNEPVMSRRL
jgi:hypothetical protein